MDVGSLLGALTGGGNVKIEIQIDPPSQRPVILDHTPSWRLHRNPFWRVKHPVGDQFVLSSSSVPELRPEMSTPYGAPSPMGGTGLTPYGSGGPGSMTPNLMQGSGTPYSQSAYQMGVPPPSPAPGGGMYGPNVGYGAAPPYTPGYPGQMQQQQQQQQSLQYGAPPPLPMPSSMAVNSSTGSAGGSKDIMYAYEASNDISGRVILRLPMSGTGAVKRMEHLGIKVQFIGRIDMTMGIHEGRPHYDFTSLSKELAPPGMLYNAETVLPFSFKNMDKELESYRGRNVAVRYIVKVMVERKFLPPVTREHDVWVQLLGQPPTQDESIKMEVGIEDCLHIEFEYDRRSYHLQDTIRGKIHFLLVRIKIKHMELAVLRRETSGEGVAAAAAAASLGSPNDRSGGGGGGGQGGSSAAATAMMVDNGSNANIYTETQTLVKYEIMDGAPVKGEVIPVKLCLRGIPADLTPTYTANNNRFSVRYFLNLVLVDEDDRRYFKQQEIILWRKDLG